LGRHRRQFSSQEQAQAVDGTRTAVWLGVVARFEHLKAAEGLRQADLAAALGVSRSQIHEWLSDPTNLTLKAAGRLLLAMGARAHVEVRAEPNAPTLLTETAPDAATLTPEQRSAEPSPCNSIAAD
jgi:transcriptional regulator with XRE-family HTH domain